MREWKYFVPQYCEAAEDRFAQDVVSTVAAHLAIIDKAVTTVASAARGCEREREGGVPPCRADGCKQLGGQPSIFLRSWRRA